MARGKRGRRDTLLDSKAFRDLEAGYKRVFVDMRRLERGKRINKGI